MDQFLFYCSQIFSMTISLSDKFEFEHPRAKVKVAIFRKTLSSL